MHASCCQGPARCAVDRWGEVPAICNVWPAIWSCFVGGTPMAEPLVWPKGGLPVCIPLVEDSPTLLFVRGGSTPPWTKCTTSRRSISQHHETEATNGDANTAAPCSAAGLVPTSQGGSQAGKVACTTHICGTTYWGTTISRKATTNRHNTQATARN